MTEKAAYVLEQNGDGRLYLLRKNQYGQYDVYEQIASGNMTNEGVLHELVKHANLGVELESNHGESEGDAQSDAVKEETQDSAPNVTISLDPRLLIGTTVHELIGKIFELHYPDEKFEKGDPTLKDEPDVAAQEDGLDIGSPEWMGAQAAKQIKQGLDFFNRFAEGAQEVLNPPIFDDETNAEPLEDEKGEDTKPADLESGDAWEITWLKEPGLLKREVGIVLHNDARGWHFLMRNADGFYKLMNNDDKRIVSVRRVWRYTD